MGKLADSAALAELISKIKSALRLKQDALTFDEVPTAGSTNPVTSGGVKAALDALAQQNTSYPDGDEVSY